MELREFYASKCTGVREKIEKGYITNALTNGKDEIYGTIDSYYVNDWYAGNESIYYWSEVYTDGSLFSIIRRGANLAGATNDELSALLEQSKINLGSK